MSWLNVLVVSPVWGMLSAQLYIQAALFLILFVFALIGLIASTEKVPRANNLGALAASASGVVVFALLIFVGSWVVHYLELTPSLAASVVFWVCFGLSIAYIWPQIPTKLKTGWRNATQEDAFLRRAFENAKNWPPKRPPEMTPAMYSVVYSDGKCQDTTLLPKEIDHWATASNKDAEGKFPYRIVRIVDPNGNTVWGK